jgi:hypothetical protein
MSYVIIFAYFYVTLNTDVLTLNLPTTTIVTPPCNVIKWQMKFNPGA